tara:strand:+ start:947 stop:1786 length:840 start_codon:yes stop_codon:yes gene_type:complete
MDAEALLALYDTPDSANPGRMLPGYDRDHARRTTAIVLRTAPEVGISGEWMERLEVIALLHDLGRAGMDPELFSRIFTLAQQAGFPVRLPELKERYSDVKEELAADLWLDLARNTLETNHVYVTSQLRDYIAMRMDYKERLREQLSLNVETLGAVSAVVEPWMEKVILYYYPHLMEGEDSVVRRMGMLLVACENFEAFNNARRGRDYYGRDQETMQDAFATLGKFQERGLVDADIIRSLACLAATGALDAIVQEARDRPTTEPLPNEDKAFLETFCRAA